MTLVEIGRVTRPHGVRGEVRVHLHWAGSETLERVRRIVLTRSGRSPAEHRVLSSRRADKAVLLRLAGVDDRDAAEALRDSTVSVDREALPPLEEGEYYLCDLVGARVLGPEGLVGEVTEVRVHPSVDTFVLRTSDGRILEQPISAPWVTRVDPEAKIVELASTDGLF